MLMTSKYIKTLNMFSGLVQNVAILTLVSLIIYTVLMQTTITLSPVCLDTSVPHKYLLNIKANNLTKHTSYIDAKTTPFTFISLTHKCRLTYHRPAQEVLCYMRLCFPPAYDTVYVWMYVWDGTTPDNLLKRSYLYIVIIMWCHHPVFSNLTLLHLLNKEIIDKIQYDWMGKCKPDVQGITINWNVSGLSLPESFSISINS